VIRKKVHDAVQHNNASSPPALSVLNGADSADTLLTYSHKPKGLLIYWRASDGFFIIIL